MSNFQITHSQSVDNARSESVVLVNPNNPQQVVASSKKFKNLTNYDFTLAVSFSKDGGRSWTEAAPLALPSGATIMSDPTFAWDDIGNVFLIGLIGKNPPAPTAIGMVAYKSTDGGKSWGAAKLIHADSGDDKQWAAGDTNPASPHHGNVYACWHNGFAPAPLQFARSLDHGATWIGVGSNTISSSILAMDGFAPEINVAADGAIYIVYLNGQSSADKIKFLKSTDGGESFSGPFVAADGIKIIGARFPAIDNYPQFPNAKFRVLSLATGCVGLGNTLIFAWADSREGVATPQSRIYYRRSLDGGATWEGPVSGQPLLNLTFPPPIRHHFHPQLISHPSGAIGCAYYLLSGTPDPTVPHIQVILAQSLDGGATFQPFTITDRPWNPATGAPLARGNPNVTFIGEYFGLDASEEGFHLNWTDTRTGMQELWGDIIPVKRCALIVERSTLGQDEVDARRGQAGGAVVPDAFRLVVDGFSATQLAFTGPGATINVASPIAGMTFICTGNTSATGEYGSEIQRFTFHYNIDFGPTNTAFGFTGETEFVTFNANVAGLICAAQIELIKQPNPFILHGDPGWLSVDLRVFSVVASQTKFGVTMGSSASDAPNFIRKVMAALTAGQGTADGDSFEGDLPVEEENNLSLFPTKGPLGLFKVFNFAIAKVHYVGLIGANDVRVFFRMFQAQATDTTFNPFTTYRRALSNPSGHPIPLAGIIDNEFVTIPFFAERRVDSTMVSMDQQTDAPNVQTIAALPGGAEVDHYFGCWLDINQPSNRVLPIHTPGTNVDGPFTDSSNRPLSIQQAMIRNPHQCLVAEIAFDGVPIPSGKTPYDWDKLAQRNLAFSHLPNPGVDGSRVALDTFEIRPTPAGLRGDQPPDELMIDWGIFPKGTTATIYLPAVNIDDVLRMASAMYTTHSLERVDSHTLRCRAAGLTYVPIPAGTDVNYAGLLSVELSMGINRGQVFRVVVRQVTNASASRPPIILFAPDPSAEPPKLEWRRVLGAFQLTIPVQTKAELLEPEERMLSVLRWIAEAIPPENRWFSVFTRYLDQVGGRVDGFGGDKDQITPSPDGFGRLPKCDHKLRWLVPLFMAPVLVLIALAPLIWSAPLAAAGVVLIVASACYWYSRCKPSVCDFLWMLILGISVAELVLGVIVVAGYTSTALFLMLALLGILNGLLVVCAIFQSCCVKCRESSSLIDD